VAPEASPGERGPLDADPPSGLTIQKSPPGETNVSLQAESRSWGFSARGQTTVGSVRSRTIR
jgi:hypothetical protein